MIPAIASALGAIVGNVVALRHANGAGRAFELYIMTGIAAELQKRGATVRVQRSDGSVVSPGDADRRFIQRGGRPTGIFDAGLGRGNPSVFLFRLPGSSREWEIWNGVEFLGRSTGTHEVDIAIVPASVGAALRGSGGGTPSGRPAVSIECKDVGSKGEADEMRAFVARMYDLTILNGHGRIPHLPKPLKRIYPGSTPHDDAYSTFWAGNRQTFNIVARRTGFRAGATAMTGYYAVQPRGPVVPGSAEHSALIDEVCTWIGNELV